MISLSFSQFSSQFCSKTEADDDGGAFEQIAALVYFNQTALATGDFGANAQGIINVC